MGTIADAYGYWEPGPAPSPVRGLFSIAEVVDVTDPHLMLGAEYMTNRCTAGCEWTEMCEPPTLTLKQFMKLNPVQGESFAVYDALDCELVGVPHDEQESRLRGTFDVKAEAVAEARLQAILQGSVALPATDLPTVVAALEEQLAKNYAGLGTLHMDRYTSLIAHSQRLLVEPEIEGGSVRTINGTPVALGRGYGRTAGKFWAGAAGRVTILRGPVVAVRTNSMPMVAGSTTSLPPRVMVEQQFVILVECVSAWSEATAP